MFHLLVPNLWWQIWTIRVLILVDGWLRINGRNLEPGIVYMINKGVWTNRSRSRYSEYRYKRNSKVAVDVTSTTISYVILTWHASRYSVQIIKMVNTVYPCKWYSTSQLKYCNVRITFHLSVRSRRGSLGIDDEFLNLNTGLWQVRDL